MLRHEAVDSEDDLLNWRYENEYRLLWLNPNEKENGMLFSMNPLNVYIGLIVDEHKAELISIAK